MAIAFKSTKGKAQSSAVDAYKYKDGENIVRIVGGILPRYMYWMKGKNNKDIPIECLAFDRTLEKFTREETDPVTERYPEMKCSWSYVVNCIDPSDGKVKVLNLKKKLFEQILNTAEDLGDPTDPDTGWDLNFKRVKTGPLAFNVEYNLNVLRCKPRPLTEEERTAVAEAKTIDEKYPRPTVAEIEKLLDRLAAGGDETEESAQEEDAAAKEAAADL